MIKTVHLALIFALVFTLNSCGPRSIDDFKEKGEGVVKSIIFELQQVKTRQELLHASKKIQHLFNELVEVMIMAQEFAKKNGVEGVHEFNIFLNDQFKTELNRIYRIDGAKAIMEKSQEQALQRLESYYR